ncbi:MAG: hypothetical protein HY852_20350 [Bradyrhizobium sp.]|uniref:hypothetical protein n=1 Tax=Bradyrhizobium sp. TaxID=376 RepID=UPI0025BF2182|nr:hypothetical protein [Bradyrhizobium sp.]MBI5264160.1 hypothetical protein [Bradyrhizobium sp.]
MGWFQEHKGPEIWEEAIELPLGDIDAAQRIRDICRSAADSAENAGSQAQPDKKSRQHRERFQRAAKAAMEIAINISDDLMRDASVSQIVELCMKADDLRTARILVRAIQSVSIREDALKTHPMLRE